MMSSIDVAAYPCSVKFRRATSISRRRVASAWRARSGLTGTGHRTKLTDSRSPTRSRQPMVSLPCTVEEVHVRIPKSEHISRPWRIHELTRDFRIEDVWALPAVGGPGDLGRLVH